MIRVAVVLMGMGTACAESNEAPIRDAGPATSSDAGVLRDAGTRDAGLWCGDGICQNGLRRMPDIGEDCIVCPADCPGHCWEDLEGWDCNSTYREGDTSFHEDNCRPGMNLSCIPWDVLSGRDDLNGPLQSCVKSCETDDDCGVDGFGDPRHCVGGMEYPGSPVEIGKICVDRLADVDEWCGPTFNVTPRLAGVESRTGHEQVGCKDDAVCAFGVVRDLNPDEGVCLYLCGLGLPPCPGDRPFCQNGVCTDAQREAGTWCGPRDDDEAGLTRQCIDAECTDVGLDEGLCLVPCDTATTAPEACDPPRVCSNFPDDCDATPAGVDRLCLDLPEGQGSVCADRRGPLLNPGQLTSTGDVVRYGDDCTLGVEQCPEPTTCVPVPTGGGTCLVGCTLTSTTCAEALAPLGLPTDAAACVPFEHDPSRTYCGGD